MAQQKKPAAGAPAQGAGGQKAAGQAAPPKAPKPPPAPKKPPGAPAQGAGGQKGGAPGAGLGAKPLTAQQTKGLAKAQASGTEAQYLKRHQGVATHQQKIGATPAPTPGAPAQGAGGNKGAAGVNATTPAPGAAPTTPGATPGASADTNGQGPAAPTVQDILNKQYGSNAASTFQQDWYGGNPLETAQAAAKRATDEALAGVRNRYASSGFGSSGREAIAEGQAIGDVNTNLGAQLAQLGTNVRGDDLNRLANMFATAGQQDIQGKQIALDANQQLANLGTGVTGIGATEQQIPGADLISTILTNLSQQPTYSQGAQKQPRK
jgi:hypothetical protein